jgi:hypothetical protein
LVLRIGSASATGLITDGAGASISVSSPTVNEGSPHAVFRVDGVEGQEVKLRLEGYTNDGAAATAKPGTTAAELIDQGANVADIGSMLQIFDGRGWQNYTPGSYVTYPRGSTMLLVRVPVLNDNDYEASESFKLVVEGKAVNSIASDDTGTVQDVGIGIINDAGQGPIFNESGSENYNLPRDDDRTLKVSNINTNEGSQYGIFKLTGNAGLDLSLSLGNTTTNTDRDATLAGFNLAYSTDDGANWVPYTWNGAAGNRPTLPSNGVAYAQVDISTETDITYEGSETFELIATPDLGAPAIGLAQILDDGTGLKFTGAIGVNGPVTTRTGLDDDLDRDGIDPNVEEILATLSSSSGGGGMPGDLNNDGTPDAEQTSVATLAWITKEYFEQGLAGELTTIQPIISLRRLWKTQPVCAKMVL